MQFIAASVSFVVSLAVADLMLPLPEYILAATPPKGFLTLPAAMALNGVVNAALLVWLARRSSLRGVRLWMQLAVLSFGIQAFQTQIETAYFLDSFPLLHGNLSVYTLLFRGLLTFWLFALLTTTITGGFAHIPWPATRWTVVPAHAQQSAAWLAAVYVVLYFVFGYFVAWQFDGVRAFYGGPKELNGFGEQLTAALVAKPEIPFFQYARGVVWLLCLVPVFRAFVGGRAELVAVSFLALALLPTVQLAFPNPLMPAEVSWAHFLEVSFSTGLFGGLCAWIVPQRIPES